MRIRHGSKTGCPITRDEKSPLELYQAYNAVRIATNVGADKYAADIMAEANQDLKNASAIDSNKKADRKMEITFARQAVQRAEDARIVTLRKQADEREMNAEIAKRDAQCAGADKSQTAGGAGTGGPAMADVARARAEAQAADARATAAEANKSAESANAVREKLLGAVEQRFGDQRVGSRA